jgi:hypothetical protein
MKRFEYQILTYLGQLTVEALNEQGGEGWELIRVYVVQRERVSHEGKLSIPIETIWKRERPFAHPYRSAAEDRSAHETGP